MQSKTFHLSISFLFLSVLTAAGAFAFANARVPFDGKPILSGSYQRAYEESFSGHIPLTEFAQGTYRAVTLALFGEAGSEVVIADRDWVFTAEEFRNPEQKYDLEEELVITRDRLHAQGITLVPIIVPDKARVYADLLPRGRSPELEARYEQVLSTLAQLDFAKIDLRTELINGRVVSPTFMRTDTHWSPFGAERAAATIADETGLRRVGEMQFETTSGEVTSFEGDLRPFVETGPFRGRVGPAEEFIQQPVTVALDNGLGLFGEAEIDAVLVGTSFSARKEFNFGGFLQAETGLNIVNLAVEGQGPFNPMHQALGDNSIFNLKPTIVFWEIPERYIHLRSLP